MRKILLSDFDGTLYVDKRVSEADRAAIRRWRRAGHLFALATGRQWSDLARHLRSEGVEYDALLCLNGSECYDREGRQIFETSIDGALLPGLFELLLQGHGCARICYGPRIEHVATELPKAQDPDDPVYPVERLHTFARFSQICAGLEDVDAAIAARERILARYGASVSAQINGNWLDVNAHGVRKSTGVGRLHTAAEAMACVEAAREAGFANLSLDFMLGLPGQSEESLEGMEDFVRRAAPQHLSVYILKVEAGTPFGEMGEALRLPDESAATVGDNFNDLSMLTAYRGYAVSRAPEEVRAKVGRTVDGVAQLVDMLLAEDA